MNKVIMDDLTRRAISEAVERYGLTRCYEEDLHNGSALYCYWVNNNFFQSEAYKVLLAVENKFGAHGVLGRPRDHFSQTVVERTEERMFDWGFRGGRVLYIVDPLSFEIDSYLDKHDIPSKEGEHLKAMEDDLDESCRPFGQISKELENLEDEREDQELENERLYNRFSRYSRAYVPVNRKERKFGNKTKVNEMSEDYTCDLCQKSISEWQYDHFDGLCEECVYKYKYRYDESCHRHGRMLREFYFEDTEDARWELNQGEYECCYCGREVTGAEGYCRNDDGEICCIDCYKKYNGKKMPRTDTPEDVEIRKSIRDYVFKYMDKKVSSKELELARNSKSECDELVRWVAEFALINYENEVGEPETYGIKFFRDCVRSYLDRRWDR